MILIPIIVHIVAGMANSRSAVWSLGFAHLHKWHNTHTHSHTSLRFTYPLAQHILLLTTVAITLLSDFLRVVYVLKYDTHYSDMWQSTHPIDLRVCGLRKASKTMNASAISYTRATPYKLTQFMNKEHESA